MIFRSCLRYILRCAAGQGGTVSDMQNQDEALLFFINVQQHIHENIKFADQKAVQVIAIDMALIGAIYSITGTTDEHLLRTAVGVCAVLGVGILFAVSVIRPRGEQNEMRGSGVLDAIRIVKHHSVSDFLSECDSVSKRELLRQQRMFVFDRACIDRDKYRQLRRSLLFSTAGWLSAFGYAALAKLVFTAP